MGSGDDARANHRFDDVAKWTGVFDDPARDEWQRPQVVVGALAITPGMTVADVGAGTGYFNRSLATAVGPEGKVIAVDIEPTLVAHMAARAEAEGTPQVTARLGRPEDPALAAGEVDRVLLVDTYHHIDDRVAWFTRLKGAMKPDGKLVIVDFKPGELPVGPPPAHKLEPDVVTGELARAGWQWEAAVTELPHQYVLVYTVAGP